MSRYPAGEKRNPSVAWILGCRIFQTAPWDPNQSKVTINLRLVKIEGKSTQTRFLGLSLRFCVIPLLGFKIQISTAKLESCDEKPCSRNALCTRKLRV